MKRFLFILCLILGLAIAVVTTAQVQKPTGSQTQQVTGMWQLASYETRNSKGELLTQSPYHYTDGIIRYEPTGRMSVQLVNNDDRPTFPTGNFTRVVQAAKTEDLQAAVLGYLAYFGTYSIDETKNTITHHVQESTNNYKGSDQVRNFELNGDQLVLVKSVSSKPGEKQDQLTSRIEWRRLPDLRM